MILYLLKSSFLLLVLLLIYKWSLENKKSLQFNRFYLLFSLLLGFLLPLLNFSFKVESNTVLQAKEVIVEQLPAFIINIEEEDNDVGFMWYEIVYYSVTTLLFFKFIFHAFTFYRLKRTGTIVNSPFGQLVLNNNIKVPFSFYKYIYLNKNDWNSNTIDDAILYHEQGHIIQKHSLDIILIELLSVFLWFQPFVFYFKRLIQENHEYLADEYSLNRTKNIKHYQHLILNCYSHKQSLVPLSSSIHFNNLKKRFIMMKNTKKGRVWETIFYSSAVLITYFGFVGIEAKANEINNFETNILQIYKPSSIVNTQQNLFRKSDLKQNTETVKSDSLKSTLQLPVKITFSKNRLYTGSVVFDKEELSYTVDGNKNVTFYNSKGLKVNISKDKYELVDFEDEKIPYSSVYVDLEYFKFKNEKKYTKLANPNNFTINDFKNSIISYIDVNKNTDKKIKYIFNVEFDVDESGRIVNYNDNSTVDDETKKLIQEAIFQFKEWQPSEINNERVISTFVIKQTIRLNYTSREMFDEDM